MKSADEGGVVSDPRADQVFVSLQASVGRGEPLAHQATGTLVGSEVAVFPLPPEAEPTRWSRLEVAICRWPVSDDEPVDDELVERIRPLHVEVASLATAPDQRVAMVRLAQRSRHGGVMPRQEDVRPQLEAALDSTRDLFGALTGSGLVPAVPVNGAAASTVVTRLRDAEHAPLARPVAEKRGRPGPEVLNCIFSDRCWPGSEPAGPG